MYIYSDLNAFERYLDFFTREEKIVNDLMLLMQRQKDCCFDDLYQQEFFESQLRFLIEEKRKIQLRCKFMHETLNDLRKAKNILDAALQTASHTLLSNDDY